MFSPSGGPAFPFRPAFSGGRSTGRRRKRKPPLQAPNEPERSDTIWQLVNPCFVWMPMTK